MNKYLGFLILILLSVYVFFLYIDPRRIFTYTTERYFFVILGSAILILILGFLGFAKDLRTKDFRSLCKEIILYFKDPKTSALMFIIGISLLFNPIFLGLGALVVLISSKESKFDEFLRSIGLKQIILVLVLFAGILIPSGQISSVTANQRIGNLNDVILSDENLLGSSFGASSESYDIGDWLVSLSYNPDLNFYVGKKVDLVGFIFAPENLPEDVFILGRFVIRCCAADATPVGLKVETNWKEGFKRDEWVRVKGSFDIREINGISELIIKVDTIDRTEVPERPYIN